MATVGDARLLIDGEVIIDNRSAPRGGSFFGAGTYEQTATTFLVGGQPYLMDVHIDEADLLLGPGGVHIGAVLNSPIDLVDEAVAVAASCDATVLVVGTSDDWESEGWDRETLALPGRQDELISAVAAVSRRTIVVVNAGSPISMPWLAEVDAVIYAWFPGQEMGDALVDVLLGDVEPQGRLPVTMPRALEDTPAFEHHPGRNGIADYREGRLIGYRWYDTVGRSPLFPFGFGLGYATVEIMNAQLLDPFTVQVTLANKADRDGFQVVQAYAHGDASGSDQPDQCLVGFAKVAVAAGESATCLIVIDSRAYQTWDASIHDWVRRPGPFEIRIGTSSWAIDAILPVHNPN